MENSDLLLRIAGIVLPLFGIIAAGWWYGRHQRPNMALANQLNMEVFVPALVFAVMADTGAGLGVALTNMVFLDRCLILRC